MQTTRLPIVDAAGQNVLGSRALVWGNNASWVCLGCNELVGNRTGDTEFQVTCDCGLVYEILRGQNTNGNLNLGPAIGVRQL
jgi:hypothetical protein